MSQLFALLVLMAVMAVASAHTIMAVMALPSLRWPWIQLSGYGSYGGYYGRSWIWCLL
ncbi:hypothetical protein Ocin01_02321 [Orchesella cincta]|uniref:Uncharacterized protein n=1 Tax=Orchesella cincta TaxID=48709 RepID=A0A1D2NGJ2_ORCCI|nr:hypothetical protein Ocin01_02321 [Orchesella cincta]